MENGKLDRPCSRRWRTSYRIRLTRNEAEKLERVTDKQRHRQTDRDRESVDHSSHDETERITRRVLTCSDAQNVH